MRYGVVGVWLLFVACGGTAETSKDGASDSTLTEETDTTADTPVDTPADTPQATAACDTTNEACALGVGGCRGEGPEMLPGSNCLACHSGGGRIPEWTAGGTAFKDVDGSAPLKNVIVRVTDSTGKVVEMTTNVEGNFYTNRSLTPPLRAEIEKDGAVRAMAGEVPTGACSECHACEGAAGGKLYGP